MNIVIDYICINLFYCNADMRQARSAQFRQYHVIRRQNEGDWTVGFLSISKNFSVQFCLSARLPTTKATSQLKKPTTI